MNDAIDPSLCSLTYVTVDTVAAAISLGRRSLLASNHYLCVQVMWWKTFAAHWNGVALIISPKSETVLITSDTLVPACMGPSHTVVGHISQGACTHFNHSSGLGA